MDSVEQAVAPNPQSTPGNPIFICYRQEDGEPYASWVEELIGKELRARNDNTPIYLDKTAPAADNWRISREAALTLASCFVVICTPGLWPFLPGEKDEVQYEIEWWDQHRKTPPIVVDTTDGRRVPDFIKSRWKDLNRVNVTKDLWKNENEPDRARHYRHIVEQIMGEILGSKLQIPQQELARIKSKNLYLTILSCALSLALLALIILIARTVREDIFIGKQNAITESRTLAIQAEMMVNSDQGNALDLAIQAWQKSKTKEAHHAIAISFRSASTVLEGHSSAIMMAGFSPDGSRIVTAGRDYQAALWNAATGDLI